MAKIQLSLIIPAYNESGIILNHVDELAQWMATHQSDLSFEIIVIDDGSTDGMSELLNNAVNTRSWLRVEHHSVNIGRGRAVRTGFDASCGEYIICLDADLSYSPEHISKLLNPLKSGEADISLASVYHPDGKTINVPRQRLFLSKLGNRILSLGFSGKLSTVTCVVRGYTRRTIDSLELVNDGKELHLEVIQKAQLLGCRIVEVPAILQWRDRKRGLKKSRNIFPEIAIFKMRKTVISHLVFNYITNPGIILFIPIVSLLMAILSGTSMLMTSFFQGLHVSDLTMLQVLRETLINGQLTLMVVTFSFVFLMIFVGFYFLSFQNKRYFEESYTMAMRMNARIKEIELEMLSKSKN